MKFNLEEMKKYVEEAKQKEEKLKKATNAQEAYEQYSSIIKGVARKYGSSKWVDADELESELWLKVLTLANSLGWENLNEKFIAKICWNRAVDFYRSARRNWERKAEYIDEYGYDDQSNESDIEKFQSKMPTGYDSALIDAIANFYEPGTRERKFVLIKLYNFGLIDAKYIKEEKIVLPEHMIDANIFLACGFGSPKSASCFRMKHRIEAELKDWLERSNEF